MAYIGTKPTVGNFQICDAISVVNGQAAYTMQVGSVNVIPQSANHMIVSLNGTIQKPNSSYTVSGSTITFASNLATGDVIDFIQILGDVLDLGVPSDATCTTAKLADDAVTYAKIGYNANQFRNIIINGDMSQAQRGTSASSLSSGNSYHGIDRYKTQIVNTGTWTQSQSTTVPSGQGFGYSLKMDCTTADASLGADDFLVVRQDVEAQNLQYLKYGTSNAESITMSFWIRSNKTGIYNIWLFAEDNSKSISAPYTILSANTWEKKTITFAGDTASSITNDNGTGIRVYFILSAGSNWTSGTTPTTWEADTKANRAVGQVNLADSTANEWYVTGVQLEAGTTASDFEFLPVDVNLQRCLRYCYRINGNSSDEQQVGGAAWCTTTSRVNFVAEFNPPLRSVPTVTSSSDIKETISGTSSLSTGGLFDDNQSGLCNTVGIAIQPSSGTPFTANQVAFPRLANSTSSFIQYDSEL